MTTESAVESLPVKQIMTASVEVLTPNDTIQDAVQKMVDGNISTIPVVEVHNKCVGILSRNDFAEMMAKEDLELSSLMESDSLWSDRLYKSLDTCSVTKVKELMTYDVVTISENQTVLDACKEMASRHVHHLPVVNDENVVKGIVSAFDVVCAVANQS